MGQVKWLTGGGSISARPLYGHEYHFSPCHLLLLLTNHKPHHWHPHAAFWDRVRLVSFNLRFVDTPVAPNERRKDRGLEAVLREEASGILAWLVRGCLSWQRDGIGTPPEVKQAAQSYQAEEDTLGQFLSESCVVAAHATVKAGVLYQRYQEWMHSNGLKPMSGPTFGTILKKRYEQQRAKHRNIYCGLGLLEETMLQGSTQTAGVGGVGGNATFSLLKTSSSQKEKGMIPPTPPTPGSVEEDEEEEVVEEEDQEDDPNRPGPCLTQFDGTHVHEAMGTRRGFGGWWCERCTAQYGLMERGEQLGYPLIEVHTHEPFSVRAGRGCWMHFALQSGDVMVQRALDAVTPPTRAGP